MTRPALVRTFFFLAIVMAPLLVPGVRWRLWGTLRGESFYRGRPTSYWSREVSRCPKTSDYRCSLAGLWHAPRVPATRVDGVKAVFGLPHTVTSPRFPLRDDDPSAVPVLIDLLKDPDPGVRMYAAESLGGLGTAAAAAVPALTESLRDEDVGGFGYRVCDRAAWALERVRGQDPDGAGVP
jgi:hypothetical protein